MRLGLQGEKKNEGELQRMARNLTVAIAPDDFKEANKLEPQVGITLEACVVTAQAT
jgi:hypothetical protein